MGFLIIRNMESTIDYNLLDKLIYAYFQERGYSHAAFALKTEASLTQNSRNNFTENNLVDLILMDIKMPEMDGKEAATIIRSNHQLQQPRIIAMTAGTSDDDISDCYQSGMDDYLAKPFHKEDLLNKIQQTILQRNKKQMEIDN